MTSIIIIIRIVLQHGKNLNILYIGSVIVKNIFSNIFSGFLVKKEIKARAMKSHIKNDSV